MTLRKAIGGVRAHWRALLLLSLAAFAMALSAPAAALANANFVGTWEPNTGGGWTVTSQEPSGACTGTTVFVGYTFTGCHVSGNEYEFYVDVGSYESRNHGIIEGNKVTGEFNDTNGTNQPYTAVRTGGPGTITGQVLDQRGNAAVGVKVSVQGKTDEEVALEKTTESNSIGAYSFEVPAGTYTVSASGEPDEQNGGTLAVATSSGKPVCNGTAKEASCELSHLPEGESAIASFTYTQCAASSRTPNEKPATGCPIVFIPGILGSRIVCPGKELYFPGSFESVHFNEMLLQSDGENNAGAPGSCNASAETPAGEAGVLTSVDGQDAYGSILSYLKGIATNGVYPFPYDWRRSVPHAAAQLKGLVNEVLTETGAKHVVLVAHSMGGLVTQDYIANATNAEKVTRAVTIGTPYWGAPKSMIALMAGKANEFSTESLDVMFGGEEGLEEAVRNYVGLFWLYPSAAYGPWLQIEDIGYPAAPVGGTGIDNWVRSLGGNTTLLDAAEAGHAGIDSFQTNGVDYQIVVGIGLPTITGMQIAVKEFEPTQWVKATYGSGDATVPAISQTHGAFPGSSAPGDNAVPIHYVCKVKHSDEPGNGEVQGMIKGFVLKGGGITGQEPSACTYSGKEMTIYHVKIAKHGATPHGTASAATVTSGSTSMTLEEAISKQLVQVLELGGQTVVTTSESEPVTLKLSGNGLALRIRSISSSHEGASSYYGPVNGTITINPAGTVMHGAKKVRAHKLSRAPRTSAHVSRHGSHYVVRLKASDPAGVKAIYYRIGKGARHVYGKPLRLTRSQLKRLRFSSVDVFGTWGRVQRVSPPH
jgi:pimeloyl-ACP methyl ester carboxylesterase